VSLMLPLPLAEAASPVTWPGLLVSEGSGGGTVVGRKVGTVDCTVGAGGGVQVPGWLALAVEVTSVIVGAAGASKGGFMTFGVYSGSNDGNAAGVVSDAVDDGGSLMVLAITAC
jgi:hypothetical protein